MVVTGTPRSPKVWIMAGETIMYFLQDCHINKEDLLSVVVIGSPRSPTVWTMAGEETQIYI